MSWRLRVLAEDIWLPSSCRLCGRPTRGAATAVRGSNVDKPPPLPAPFAALAQRLCAACLTAYAHPGGQVDPASGLVPGAPALHAWIGSYGSDERQLIHRLKYRGRADLAATLGELLAVALAAPWQRPHVLVPIPLHTDRQRARGYNQAALIARSTAARLGWPVCDALERVRPTHIQAGLDRAGREANVAGAFAPRSDSRRKLRPGTRLLLIDDICTTGATLAAAAAACRRLGAEKIGAAVLFVAPAGDIDFHVELRGTNGGVRHHVP